MAPRMRRVIETLPSLVVALPLGNRFLSFQRHSYGLWRNGEAAFPPTPMAVFAGRTHKRTRQGGPMETGHVNRAGQKDRKACDLWGHTSLRSVLSR